MLTMWYVVFFFFKQKTAYELRISDWSSDVCSSDLLGRRFRDRVGAVRHLDDVAGDGGVPPDAGSVRCCPGAAVADGAARYLSARGTHLRDGAMGDRKSTRLNSSH